MLAKLKSLPLRNINDGISFFLTITFGGVFAFILAYSQLDSLFTGQPFRICIALLFFICLGYYTATVYFKIDRPKNKKEARDIVEASANIVALCSLGMETCDELLESDEIEKITNKYKQNIRAHFDVVKAGIDTKLHHVITEGFLHAAFEAKRTSKRENAFGEIIRKAYNELADLNEVESFVKQQSDACRDEIKSLIINNLKSKDPRRYAALRKSVNEKIRSFNSKRRGKIFFWYNPRLKDILRFDFEKKILIASALIPAASILTKKVIIASKTHTLGSIANIFLAPGADDFIDPTDYADVSGDVMQDVIHDHLHDTVLSEIGDHLVQEISEFAFAAIIPYVGAAFLILKVFRWAGLIEKLSDKSHELEKLRQNIAQNLRNLLDEFCDKATDGMEEYGYNLVLHIRDSLEETQKEAKQQMAWAEKYC